MSYIVNNKFLCLKNKTKPELKRSNSEPAISLNPPAVLKKFPSAIHSDHTDLDPCVEDFSPKSNPVIQDSLDIPMHVINALVEGLENFNYVNKHTFYAIDGGVKSINLIGNSSLINCHLEKLRKNLTNNDFEYASKLPKSQQYIKKNKLGNLSFDFKAVYERYLTLDKKDILTREEENEHNFTKDLVVLNQLHKFNSISKGVREFIRAISGITGIGGYLTFIKLGFTPVTLPLTLIPDFVPAGIELCETLADKRREKSLNGNNNAYKRFTGDMCSIVTDEKKNKDFKNIVKHIFEQAKQIKENPSFRFNLNEVTREQWDPKRPEVTLAINHLLLMLCSEVFEKAKKCEKIDKSLVGDIFNKVVITHAPKENGNVFTHYKEMIRDNEAKNDITANAISRDITGFVKAIA